MTPLSIALGFAPIALLLIGLVGMDCYKLVSKQSVARSVLAGAVAAAIAWAINFLALDLASLPPHVVKWWIAPTIEEALKFLWIVRLIRLHRVGFLVDAGIHGFAVGTGFAVAENIYYANALGDSGPLLWLVRGLGTAVMHGGAAAIAAILARDQTERRAMTFRRFAPGYLVAVLVHGLFNWLPFSPLVATASIVLIVPLVLIVAYERSEGQTRDWLGTSMDREIELLESIHSGEIAETHVGAYLTELRERFPGPVVADMLCLLEVHASLAMQAKGVLIAQGVGIDLPVAPEVAEQFRELRYLERAIGPTGMLAIMPFLKRGSRDGWQIKMLEVRSRGGAPRASLLVLVVALFLPTPAFAQTRDSLVARTDSSATRPRPRESRIYVGGSMGFSVTRSLVLINVQPQIGYKLSPRTSVGTRLGYEYVRDRRQARGASHSNVGVGLFARYRFHPQAFAHAELEVANLDLASDREWIPFLWLGGGYARPLAPRTWLIAEVLVDVLQSDRAPSYRAREPRVNAGVVVGF